MLIFFNSIILSIYVFMCFCEKWFIHSKTSKIDIEIKKLSLFINNYFYIIIDIYK